MLNIERYNLILQMLEERRSIRLQDIVEKLNISEATVRRDLNFLEKSGKLKRVRGGATFIDEKEEDIDYKKVLNLKGKNKIAKEAAAQINDGDIMFLDAGSTTQCVIKYLKEKKNIKVVTNGFTHIQELTNLGIETYIVGGKIKKRTGAVVGSIATHLLGKYNFDVVLLGANAVNEEMEKVTILILYIQKIFIVHFSVFSSALLISLLGLFCFPLQCFPMVFQNEICEKY